MVKRNKPVIKVVVDIRPGPGTPGQRAAWEKFWDKINSEVSSNGPVRKKS